MQMKRAVVGHMAFLLLVVLLIVREGSCMPEPDSSSASSQDADSVTGPSSGGQIGNAVYLVTEEANYPPEESMELPKDEQDIPYPVGDGEPPEENEPKEEVPEDDGERDRLDKDSYTEACGLCMSLTCPQYELGLGYMYYDERCTGLGEADGCKSNTIGCRYCRIPNALNNLLTSVDDGNGTMVSLVPECPSCVLTYLGIFNAETELPKDNSDIPNTDYAKNFWAGEDKSNA
eukprot:Nk52_evm66s210 gene=Nk52_evmTU66s210